MSRIIRPMDKPAVRIVITVDIRNQVTMEVENLLSKTAVSGGYVAVVLTEILSAHVKSVFGIKAPQKDVPQKEANEKTETAHPDNTNRA